MLVLALVALSAAATPKGARFDAAAAWRHLERLVAFGPRPSGSVELEQARQYILEELKRAGVGTRVERFTAATPHGRIPMANLVGVVPGRRPDVVLLAGHYDTKWFREVRFVGANDGGSSAALLLELARALRAVRREYTYWVAFFDGEEARENWSAADSLYGSRHMARELARARRLPRAVIVVDMIGDRDLRLRREALSTPWLTDLVWAAAARLGHAARFTASTLAVEDDHQPFLRAGVPATLLIDFEYPPWHTADDTLDKVSAHSLQIVGDVLLESLATLEAALSREGGNRRPGSTASVRTADRRPRHAASPGDR